jgi:hypothetical protein
MIPANGSDWRCHTSVGWKFSDSFGCSQSSATRAPAEYLAQSKTLRVQISRWYKSNQQT